MSGSQILKDTFYREKLLSLSTTEQSLNVEKKKLRELSKSPIDPETIVSGLSSLGKTADGTSYSYLSIDISNKDLFSIMGLDEYVSLQNVNVSHNNLVTLKPLSALKYLLTLNARGNKLGKLLDFVPPLNLEEVDYSENDIKEIPDLSKNRFLRKLVLDQNHIQKIEGIYRNNNLYDLRINNNQIEKIENLDNLNLIELHLQGNFIKSISGLQKLPKLRVLNLSRNQISKLSGLDALKSLRNLQLSDNSIKNVKELAHLEKLEFLSVLDFCFNPIQQRRFYRFQVLFNLPQLRVLDGMAILAEELVKSENFYGLELEERKEIFKKTLEEEEFVDRRINFIELVDPESESDDEEINFIDQYDNEGKVVVRTQSKIRSKQGSQTQFSENSVRGSMRDKEMK